MSNYANIEGGGFSITVDEAAKLLFVAKENKN
jgi:hypothetical protein